MAKDNKAFELFQSEFQRYQEYLGLTAYTVRFECRDLGEARASIHIWQEEMVACVSYHNHLTNSERGLDVVREDAKHEALHLLTGRMREYAYARHITRDDIYEANEELVRRLNRLIPDLSQGI